MRLKRGRLILVLSIVAAFWAAFGLRDRETGPAPVSLDERRPQSSGTAIESVSATQPEDVVQPINVAPVQGSSTMKSFAFNRELATYMDIQSKVIVGEEDKRARSEVLANGEMLRALGETLLEPARSPEAVDRQDAAIDILLAALSEGNSQVAAEVLQGVVKDAKIENSAMERSSREQLAGLKAEVLYQWSALQPAMTSNLEGWLPGPISQKIWENVQRMQRSNLAESEAEIEERATRH